MSLSLPSGTLSLDRTRIMGILNVTRDSFYDGGFYLTLERALERAEAMVEAGADIIDVGGEKAGPGAPVTVNQELDRVVPVVEGIKARFDVRISVDTRRSAVAHAAVRAGADIINSITGFADPDLRRVARDTGAGIVVMHIQGKPRVANPSPKYTDVMHEVVDALMRRIELCRTDGIASSRIIVDAGPGFGKTTEHDLTIMTELQKLTELPYPVLLAASRKKFIGDVLEKPVEQRLAGSLAVVAWGVLQGVKLLRVHDVAASIRVCRMTEAVLDTGWKANP
ncbi:MAG: dihydropteroate synthase [Chloroflexota bacterium]